MPKPGHTQSKPAPSAKFRIRALTKKEIERLELALENPVNRRYLVHWVSQAIRDVANMPTQPTPRECRDDISKIVRDGRRLVGQIDRCRGKSLLQQNTDLDQLTSELTQFCDQAEGVAKNIGVAVKAGHPRIPFNLEAFLDRMIGIAKRAKVLPSTPGRAPRSHTDPRLPPAFFCFVKTALAIGRDVIESSQLPDDRKKMALAVLRVQSDEALSKILEQMRGLIGRYRETQHGLVED